jgi:ubiquinone/menaquinone biosynthesis C-methylase UbiE
MNPFLEDLDAANYDSARPYFHPLVIRRLADFFQQRRLTAALDVACGTGHSTQALVELAEVVVGLDSSALMLQRARRRGVIPYVRGLAERLPFPAGAFNLVTVGLGFHWFDRTPFLGEAHRVLRQPGWLALYDSGFAGVMKENPEFGGWRDEYVRRFPAPYRNREPLSDEFLAGVGFRQVFGETFAHTEAYSLEQLMAYLKSQTNVIAALREGRETRETVSDWLRATLTPLFKGPTGTFEYQGWVLLFAKDG